ncbi:LsmAD domain-containing protein [Aphelenchoides besseyi]|nr:LsmAD domain-containing protein [Aphelenchoides besseyi]
MSANVLESRSSTPTTNGLNSSERLESIGRVDSAGRNSAASNERPSSKDDSERSISPETREAAETMIEFSNRRSSSTPLADQQSSVRDTAGRKSTSPTESKTNAEVEKLVEKFAKSTSISATPPPSDSKNEVERRESNLLKPRHSDGAVLSDRSEALTCYNNTSKGRRGFKTDREYDTPTDVGDNEELEEWKDDSEMPQMNDDVVSSRGWSVDEMFRVNDQLGVQSSFKGIEEYSTVMPVGDEEARKRADQIAREIEKNQESSRHAFLENDDEERDLDKETKYGDRDGNRMKRQSSGYNGKGPRVQYNNSNNTNGRGTYSNGGSRNVYPKNTNNQPRYDNSPRYQKTYANTAAGRSSAPSSGWRQGNEQLPPLQSTQQPIAQSVTGYKTTKSPSLHPDERRQSASPALTKNASESTSIRRANSAHSKQNPIYNTRVEPAYTGVNPTSIDRRGPEISGHYHDSVSQNPSVHPTVEIHGIVPKQPPSTPSAPPASVSSYGNESASASQAPSTSSPTDDSTDKPKKKFTFNPNAAVFVPKSQPANKPPSMVPINVGAAHQIQQQHAAAVVAGVPSIPHNPYVSVQQMMPMTPQVMQIQSPLLIAQTPFQPIHQQVPQQPPYQQLANQTAARYMMQPVASLPPQITGHNIQQQSTANITYMNHGAPVSATPYQQVPPPILSQQPFYPPNLVCGYSPSVAPSMLQSAILILVVSVSTTTNSSTALRLESGGYVMATLKTVVRRPRSSVLGQPVTNWRLFNNCSGGFVQSFLRTVNALGRNEDLHGDSPKCRFKEHMDSGGYTLIESAYNKGIYLGFDVNGHLINAANQSKKRRCLQFTKLSSEITNESISQADCTTVSRRIQSQRSDTHESIRSPVDSELSANFIHNSIFRRVVV